VLETIDATPTLRVTRWIWVLPVLVSAVLAARQGDSLASAAMGWLYFFLPQFLVLGVVIAEKVSKASLVASAIAAAFLAVLLYWMAEGWGVWTWLIYLFVMPAVFAGAWVAVWIDRRATTSHEISRAIACSASILLFAGFGYLVWMRQVIEL
jgi:hypothetical protein